MVPFKPIQTTNETSLNNIGVREGQLIICEEEKKLYFDKNNTERILIKSKTKSPLKLVNFSEGTDEDIAIMLNEHYNGEINISDYWSVGDTRKIHLNTVANPKGPNTTWWQPQDITIVITAMNHHNLVTPINGITKAAITCQTRECVNNNTALYNKDGHIRWNLTSTAVTDPNQVHWTAIGMRTWGNEAFFGTMLSEGTKNIIKPIKHNVLSTRGISGTENYENPAVRTTEEAIDNIFLPTYQEVFGNTAHNYYLNGEMPDGEEGTQWEYYKTSANRIKYANNNGVSNQVKQTWWVSSPSTNWTTPYGGFWCYIDKDGSTGCAYTEFASGYAPAFCM